MGGSGHAFIILLCNIILLLYKYLWLKGLYELLLAGDGMGSYGFGAMYLYCTGFDKIMWLNLYNKLLKYCLYIYSL